MRTQTQTHEHLKLKTYRFARRYCITRRTGKSATYLFFRAIIVFSAMGRKYEKESLSTAFSSFENLTFDTRVTKTSISRALSV